MKNVLALLAPDEIRVLTMDREFVGKKWLAWLQLMGVRYVVRVKKNTLIGALSASHLSTYGRWKKQAGELQGSVRPTGVFRGQADCKRT